MNAMLYIAAWAIGGALVVRALAWARSCGALKRCSVAGASVCAGCALAWTLWAAVGGVVCEQPIWGAAVVLSALGAGAATLVGPAVRTGLGRAGAVVARATGLAALVPVALFVLEWPYNYLLFQMDPAIVGLNVCLVGAVALAFWFLFGRRRAGALLFAGACLVFGMANYFLCLFKGQTVLPADVLALGTAAEVSAGYDFVMQDAPAQALAAFMLLVAAWSFVPAGRVSRRMAALNLTVGLALVAGLVNWYATTDIEEAYGVKVDVWSTRDSYMEYGSLPSFLQRMQEVDPHVPDGYSTEGAAALCSDLAASWDEDHPGYPQTQADAVAYQEELTGSGDLPTVVVVMNESFSDLSSYPGVEGYEGTDVYDALDAQLRGLVYTSVRGGGTCNSEFEYLTGTTLGSMGGGVYPYMFYDLSGAESLAKAFSALGYETTALHPAAASNWRRDVVYRALGFDAFLSEEDFGDDPETLRDLVSDAAVYDKVLDVLSQADGAPQFLFAVTLQNHGGYTTGLLGDPYADATVNGETIEGMGEYLACIDSSEDDLAAFLDELRALDRKVVVVFFGDHQPGFNDEVAEAAYGCAVADLGLEQVQQRFATPYMVWANYDLGLDASWDEPADTSLNYLGAMTMWAAGLPLTDFQKATLQLQGEMPAVNLNGYQGADGTWYWIGEDGPVREAYDEYETLQYADLFDARAASAR